MAHSRLLQGAFGVLWSLGFRVQDLGLTVLALGFRV